MQEVCCLFVSLFFFPSKQNPSLSHPADRELVKGLLGNQKTELNTVQHEEDQGELDFSIKRTGKVHLTLPLVSITKFDATSRMVSVKWQGGPKVRLHFMTSKEVDRWLFNAVEWVSFLRQVPICSLVKAPTIVLSRSSMGGGSGGMGSVASSGTTGTASGSGSGGLNTGASTSSAIVRGIERRKESVSAPEGEQRKSPHLEMRKSSRAQDAVDTRKIPRTDGTPPETWGYRRTKEKWEWVHFRLVGSMFQYFRNDDPRAVPLGYMDTGLITKAEYTGSDGEVEVIKLSLRSGHWRVIGLHSRKDAEFWRSLLRPPTAARTLMEVVRKSARSALGSSGNNITRKVQLPPSIEEGDDDDGATVEVELLDLEEFQAPDQAQAETSSSVMLEMPLEGDSYAVTESDAIQVHVSETGNVEALRKVHECLQVYDSEEVAGPEMDEQLTTEVIALQSDLEDMMSDIFSLEMSCDTLDDLSFKRAWEAKLLQKTSGGSPQVLQAALSGAIATRARTRTLNKPPAPDLEAQERAQTALEVRERLKAVVSSPRSAPSKQQQLSPQPQQPLPAQSFSRGGPRLGGARHNSPLISRRDGEGSLPSSPATGVLRSKSPPPGHGRVGTGRSLSSQTSQPAELIAPSPDMTRRSPRDGRSPHTSPRPSPRPPKREEASSRPPARTRVDEAPVPTGIASSAPTTTTKTPTTATHRREPSIDGTFVPNPLRRFDSSDALLSGGAAARPHLRREESAESLLPNNNNNNKATRAPPPPRAAPVAPAMAVVDDDDLDEYALTTTAPAPPPASTTLYRGAAGSRPPARTLYNK